MVVKYSLQVLITTKASSVAADLRICEIFEKYYGELCQKKKLADSGEFACGASFCCNYVIILAVDIGVAQMFCFFVFRFILVQSSAKSTSYWESLQRFTPAIW